MKIKNLLLILFTAFAFSANAQNIAIKVNPFGLLFGSAGAGVELGLTENISVEAGASYSSVSGFLSSEDVKYKGIGFYVSPKLYFKKNPAIKGLYLAPIFKYSNNSAKASNGDKVSSTYTNMGVLFGKQWIWGDDGGFVLDLGIGAGKASSKNKGNSGDGIDVDGILPLLRVAIGYAF